jgi:tripartite-type tricarboxylate transporter receptor subunit TctC
MSDRRRTFAAAVVLAFTALAGPALAAWPEKPVRIVVTFAAGGALPKEVTDKLAKAVADIVADPAILKRFEELGITPAKMGSAEFSQFVAKQVADWGPAIKAADLKP